MTFSRHTNRQIWHMIMYRLARYEYFTDNEQFTHYAQLLGLDNLGPPSPLPSDEDRGPSAAFGRVRERGSAPKGGRHSTICFDPQ